MERLTKRKYGEIVSAKKERSQTECSCFCNNCSQGTGNCDYVKEIVEKLAAYEDAEEQGLLLRLPCKPGSKVYCLRSSVPTKYTSMFEDRFLEAESEIIEGRVVNVKALKRRNCIKVALRGKCLVVNYSEEFLTTDDFEYIKVEIGFGAIGKTVFLSMEEAEQALKDLMK